MGRIEKTVFLSYRRTSVPWALAISQNLTHNAYDVFFDFTGLASGDFAGVILDNIHARAHFLVLLTPSALERCNEPADWLRLEVETALDSKRNIVPLMLEGFSFSTPSIANQLTGRLAVLKKYNAMTVSAEYFEAAMEKLRNRFLKVALETVVQPASPVAAQAATEGKAAFAYAPSVAEQELTAQQWFEQGVDATDPDAEIRFNTEAIRLKPDFAEAFYNRGLARHNKGELAGAIQDYNEAIRLNPDDDTALSNRGNARARTPNNNLIRRHAERGRAGQSASESKDLLFTGCPISSPLAGVRSPRRPGACLRDRERGGRRGDRRVEEPASPSFGRVGLFVSVLLTILSVPAISQTAITDPTKLQSRNIENMQNFTIEKLYMTRNIGGSTWSPDGKQIAFVSNISGRNNIWLVSSAGGWPSQLTSSEQRQTSPAWSPDGNWIAYASDTDGNEQWDIFLVSPKSGEVLNLTTTKEISEESPVWSPDSKQVAYTVKPKSAASHEIDLMDVYSRHVKHITHDTPKGLSNFAPIFSHDGKFVVYTQSDPGGKDSNVFIVEIASGTATNLTAHEGEQTFRAADISPDGKTILITSNASNGYDNVGLLDIATKKIEWLTDDKWEIRAGAFSPGGATVTWAANVDGNTNLYVYDLAARKAEMLPLNAGVNSFAGNHSPYSGDGSKLLYNHNGPTAPNDVWTYDLKSKSSQQITHSLMAGIRSTDMVDPYLVNVPSRDGKWTISAFAYIPNNIPRNGKFPAIVWIHGGPTGQYVNSFNRAVQYLVNQGYLVIAPNFRGSTGYGKEFMKANYRDEGGGDLADVVDAAQWIAKSGFVDPKKLVSMGGSYGGYLTMMAVTKYPDLWGAGVAIVPYTNWFTELATEDPAIRAYDISIMGDPVENKALYEDRSPINFIDRIKAPILLIAGGNDVRDPRGESEQVAAAIKKNGGFVQIKIYENEGHQFSRIENQIDSWQRVSDFLKVRVPSPGCGCSIYE